MVDFYFYRIINNLKKWTNVPAMWNEKVQHKLIEEGYILNDDGTVTKQ